MSASGAYAVVSPPSDQWTLDCGGNDNRATIALSISNPDDVLAWGGLLTKTWGDPTGLDPTQFISLGDTGAVLQWLTVEVDADPVYNLHFSIRNKNPYTTIFSFSESIESTLPFPTIDARGKASAGISITDANGDGATAVGQRSGGAFYEAYYNGSSVFASLISNPVSVSSYDTVTANGSKPWTYIGPVSSINSQFEFSLTAYDLAAGTSTFVVEPVPEPTTIIAMLTGLIGFAGFLPRRRSA